MSYVATETINGVSCDHVAVHGDREDLQLWIARGDQPLLQRVVITYRRAEGEPQFWGQVRKWDLSPDITDSVFTFAPPAGFGKIPFQPHEVAAHSAGDAKGSQP